MSKVSQFADRVNTAFGKLETAVDGVTTDVAALKAEIEKLQNTPGDITPEDQAILDGIQARAEALGDKAAALDELTTPPTPEEPA